MAKLTAPLMSFAASGQLAKTLVFMRWKGIPTVRQYVIPANPKSTGQITQRGYFEDGVDDYHDTAKLNAADKTAWNRYAAILAKPMSGFNAFVKSFVDIAKVPLTPNMGFQHTLITGGAGLFDAAIFEDGAATSCFLDWGYSKTALVNTVAMAEIGVTNEWIIAGVAATVGATVYARFRPHAGADDLGETGIYQLVIV